MEKLRKRLAAKASLMKPEVVIWAWTWRSCLGLRHFFRWVSKIERLIVGLTVIFLRFIDERPEVFARPFEIKLEGILIFK